MLKYVKISNFFQNTQNLGSTNFDFWFLSRAKKAAVNYFLYEWKHIIMKKWKNLSIPHPILCVVSKFVWKITTKRVIGWGKNGELLTWNLQTTSQRQGKCCLVHRLQSDYQIYTQLLKLRRCGNESTIP